MRIQLVCSLLANPRLPELKAPTSKLELSIEIVTAPQIFPIVRADFFINKLKKKKGLSIYLNAFLMRKLVSRMQYSYLERSKARLNVSSCKKRLMENSTQLHPLVAQIFTHHLLHSIYDRHFWRRKPLFFKSTTTQTTKHSTMSIGLVILCLPMKAAKHSLEIALVNDYMKSKKKTMKRANKSTL